MAPVDPYRLPRTVVPRRYELELRPDLEAATFAGHVAISVGARTAVDEIVLNAVDLEIDEAWVDGPDGRIDATVSLDEHTERATFTLGSELAAGDAVVHARFRGVLNDKLHGFYRSTFTDDGGAEHVIATTQFEATDARRAFPCWDEPEAKAVFSVILVVPDHLTAVSNAAEESRDDVGDGLVAVRFADTIVMSTYLVAFVVGPLEVTDPVDVDGTPLRIVHPPGKGHLTAFALESGAFALRHFQEYFGIAYPGGKLDLVAVPDFAFGAMENLGCVTFRETALLVDPERATQAELQNVADIIHHEIAHMWFGDLVTMKWWNGIWLNEAFATFMEMRCTDAFRADWDRWTDFGISRAAAYDTDALASTRPIEFEVVSPEEAEGMFDILTYEKGAAVVRMLEQYLGEDTFRDGIRRYMQLHQYGNTETTDLWDAIEAATEAPVRRIMDSWIFQGGHPVVGVDLVDDGRALRLRQDPQRLLGDDDHLPTDRRWVVPVLVRYGADGDPSERSLRTLLDDDEVVVPLEGPADWVLVNSGGSGFFRVRYTPDLLTLLTQRAAGRLSALERFTLVDDMWASVLAGGTTTAEYLSFLRAFAQEDDVSVWQRVIGSLTALDRIVPDDARSAFAGYVRALLAPALLKLGDPVAGEPDRTSAQRAALFEALGELGEDTAVRERSSALLATETASPGSVDADLLNAAVRVVASTGGPGVFDDLLARSRAATTPQDRLRYLGALCDLPDGADVDRFLAMSLTDDVRTQDAPYLLRRALQNRAHTSRVWDFVAGHWDEANERFPSNSIVRMLEGVRTVSDPALAAAVRAFLAEHPVPQGARTLTQHLERMGVTVALAAREADALATALA